MKLPQDITEAISGGIEGIEVSEEQLEEIINPGIC